jgi:hypothetical protein
MKSLVLAGDNASNIRQGHKKLFNINTPDSIPEAPAENEKNYMKILTKEANNFQINDLKPYDLHKSIINTDEKKELDLNISYINNNNKMILEGYLLKKSPRIGWDKRYCILKNQKFLYYLPNNRKTPAGCIDFNLMKINLDEV